MLEMLAVLEEEEVVVETVLLEVEEVVEVVEKLVVDCVQPILPTADAT